MKHKPDPVDRERRFLLQELFFSTTDRKGIITFGNDVFTRISGYGSDDLLGAPHNIIRHPDMPRVVFKLLWDYLLAGKSIVAYVKNMAADGSYYWVCALVAPIAEGFLSIRLKPTSDYFATVAKVYTELRQIEQSVEESGKGKDAGMQRSGKRLQDVLGALGLKSYDELMEKILVAEVRGRKEQLTASTGAPDGVDQADTSRGLEALRAHCTALVEQVSALFLKLGSFVSLEKALAEKVAFIQGLGWGLQLQSLNAQVRAAGLRDEGRTLQVIAEQMSGSARATSSSAMQICQYIAEVSKVLHTAAFRIATSDLNVETMSSFLDELRGNAGNEASAAAPDVRHRIAQLAEVVSTNLNATCQCVEAASGHIQRLEQRLEDFLKEIRTLEILHVTGKVEAVRCQEGQNVSSIFGEVYAKTKAARQELSGLVELVANARINTIDAQLVEVSLTALGGPA